MDWPGVLLNFQGGTSTDWKIKGIGDVDGKADFVLRNDNNGVVAECLMNGMVIDSVGFPGNAA